MNNSKLNPKMIYLGIASMSTAKDFMRHEGLLRANLRTTPHEKVLFSGFTEDRTCISDILRLKGLISTDFTIGDDLTEGSYYRTEDSRFAKFPTEEWLRKVDWNPTELIGISLVGAEVLPEMVKATGRGVIKKNWEKLAPEALKIMDRKAAPLNFSRLLVEAAPLRRVDFAREIRKNSRLLIQREKVNTEKDQFENL